MTTIYVAQPQTELKVESRQLQVFHQQKFCFAVPLHRVEQMVILGQQPWTRKAANLALSLHIPVVYFEPNGQCIEYLSPSHLEPAKYLRHQLHRSQDSEFSRSTAESLVRANLHNSRALLFQLGKDASHATTQHVLNLLQRLIDYLPMAPSLGALRSYEDTGSAFYRAALSRMLPDYFRSCNLGIHPIHRLTNLGTALLSQRIQTVLQEVGLDLEIANLHLDTLTRPPLICDFLSEFRSPIVDSLVMDLLMSNHILPDDFIWFEQGIFLQPSALEVFIQNWDKKLSAPVDHLYLGQTTYHHCLELQAQEYIACLLEEREYYRPMLVKL